MQFLTLFWVWSVRACSPLPSVVMGSNRVRSGNKTNLLLRTDFVSPLASNNNFISAAPFVLVHADWPNSICAFEMKSTSTRIAPTDNSRASRRTAALVCGTSEYRLARTLGAPITFYTLAICNYALLAASKVCAPIKRRDHARKSSYSNVSGAD